MKSNHWVGKLVLTTAVITGIAGMGCLARPVSKGAPTTKVNFTSTVSQQAVDKVDLLFAIDNSQSMGDKQAILSDAVPDLIQGLLKPACVDRQSRAKTGDLADPNGNKQNNYNCPATAEPEFKPVTDMHIGIVSSSLGNFGGNVCDEKNARTNDNALLVNFLSAGKLDRDTTNAPEGFLAWFPSNKENEDEKRHPPPTVPIKIVGEPKGDTGLTPTFTKLIGGVGQDGCGLEAQLESVYRFLIQPDPWDFIKLDFFKQADLGDGINVDVLKQRADFLRPDSLVAIIMLTDEDDSSSDPLSVGGFGYAFMARDFPGSQVRRGTTAQGTTAPRGTSKCDEDPGSDDCTSCGFAQNCDANTESCQKIKLDANCKISGDDKPGSGHEGFYGPTDDDLNVRFHRMKQRYGVDPQYPLKRYVAGFTQLRVPDRDGEHTISTSASGQRQISNYVGNARCTNPLFAAQLPRESGDELCNLPRSTRSPDLVFFAVVGGVPNKLLHFNPAGDDQAAEDNRISAEDWEKIIGKDPEHYDYSGIDPHMVQSVEPRQDLLGGGDPDLPRGKNGSDDVHGREWNTKKKDLQYACTFDLPIARPCAGNSDSCDCSDDPSNAGTAAGNPPLCATDGSPTQIKAKAYPTVREFQVVHALGDQGIISSLCPLQLTDNTLPTYGYRPAVATIIERLKNALTTQCLPQKLRSDEEEASATPLTVPCLVLAQLSPDSDATCESLSLKRPEKAVLDIFLQQQKAESGNVGDGGLDLSKLEVCEVTQKVVAKGDSCAADPDIEWCYVSNDTVNKKTPAGRCPQALLFSSGSAVLAGARFSLQCIQQFSEGQAAKDTSGSGSGSGTGAGNGTGGGSQ